MPAASSDGVMLRAHAIVETRYRENIHDRISFESVLALLLFVAVYAPAFALVTWLRPSVEVTIPLIIAASTAIAAICIGPLASLTKGIAEFGVARAPCRIGALALGMIAAIRGDAAPTRTHAIARLGFSNKEQRSQSAIATLVERQTRFSHYTCGCVIHSLFPKITLLPSE